jgi:hypothetical protein
MKKIIISLIFIILSTSIFAQNIEHYLQISINHPSELETLTRMVSIDNVTGNVVLAYANDKQFEKLQSSLFQFVKLEHPSIEGAKAITMATTVGEMANWDRYPTYSVYNQMMVNYVTDYPNLCKLDTIGTSIQNRNILVLNVTANIHTAQPKPEVLFSSTMHGDEVTGWILCLRLAKELLSKYGTDPKITNMLDSVSIFIAPNTNPDGTYRPNDNSITNARRGNNNNIDLNRNYPDPRAGQHPDGNAWQKETTVMMNFAEARHFILGINYHGGAEVANYPWDTWTGTQRKHADNNWYNEMCSEYVALARANSYPSYFTSVTGSGVVIGGNWYVITGGRQDYMNFWRSCREITLEVSNTKLPGSETLPNYWNYNKESMLTFIEHAKYGVRGIVTGPDGEPVDAKITVVGYDKDNSQVFTNPQFGNYYRMIEPGTFTFQFEAYGYVTQTITGVVSQLHKPTFLDITMSTPQSYSISGTVLNASTGAPLSGVTIKVQDTPIAPIITDVSGNFSLDILGGTYNFLFTKDDYLDKEQTIEINENTGFVVITLDPFEGFSFEDGEIPTGFTFTGNQPWYITNTQAFHGTKSIRSGNISHNQISTMSYAFEAINAGTVSFAYKVSSEAGYDELIFYIDNVEKNRWSGEEGWKLVAYNVLAGNHTLKWSYTKDTNTSDGSDCAWIDYISVPKSVQNAVPFVDPKSIAFETEALTGDTLISIWNIGNANLSYNATVEDAQSNTWITLLNNAGVVSPNQKEEIVLLYNFLGFTNGEYHTQVLIDVGDSIISIPVSIVFKGEEEEEAAIPYITPKSIDIETRETNGECAVTMKNIGNIPFSYTLGIEPEQSCEWLSLAVANAGVLDAEEEVNIMLVYDISSIAKTIYSATLQIGIADSTISIPININYIIDDITENRNLSIQVFPNPATGELSIEMCDVRCEICDIEIYDVYGRKSSSNHLITSSSNHHINISHLPAGVYFLKIVTNKGEVMKKVVKL